MKRAVGGRTLFHLAAVLVVVGLLALVGWVASAETTDIDEQIAALNAKYAALPDSTNPETILERGWSYEKEFSQIGGEAPNGDTSLSPGDYEDHAVAQGIYEPREGIPGYDLTNLWSGDVSGEPTGVFAGARVGEPDQGGVVVFNNTGQSPFIPTPVAVGTVSILSESDSMLVLEAKDGTHFIFDLRTLKFV